RGERAAPVHAGAAHLVPAADGAADATRGDPGRAARAAGPAALMPLPSALPPYTQGLLTSFPPLTGPLTRLAGIPGAPPDLRAPPPGCRFHPRCPHCT